MTDSFMYGIVGGMQICLCTMLSQLTDGIKYITLDENVSVCPLVEEKTISHCLLALHKSQTAVSSNRS